MNNMTLRHKRYRGSLGTGRGATAARLLVLIVFFILATGSLCHQTWPSFQIENISNNASFSQSPSIASTKDGHVVIAWSDSASGQENIWMVEKGSPDSQWTAPFNVSQASEPSRVPSVAFGPDGTLNIAWSQYVSHGGLGGWVIVCQSRVGSQWATAETLSKGVSSEPRLAADVAGRLHLLFWNLSADEVCYSSKGLGGSWAKVEALGERVFENELAVDAAGTCYAVWDSLDTTAIYRQVLVYSTRPAGGAWASPRVVLGSQRTQGRPALACRDTTCHLAFSAGGSGLWLTDYQHGTGWVDLDTACPGRLVSQLGMAIDSDGNSVAVWSEVPRGLKVARKSGAWETLTLSDTLYPHECCRAAADGLGNIHVVWDSRGTLYTNRPEIYYACIRWSE